MKELDFMEFSPPENVPLVISFVEMMRSKGLYVVMSWDNWDFLAYKDTEEPVLAIKTVKNRISTDVLSRLMADETSFKVVLIEGDRVDLENLRSQRLFLASARVGVYVRRVGWLSLPSEDVRDDIEELRLKLSKRWKQGKDGVWRKQCRSCGEWKTADEFYRAHNRTAKDPYRNDCKECFKLDIKLRRVAKRGK